MVVVKFKNSKKGKGANQDGHPPPPPQLGGHNVDALLLLNLHVRMQLVEILILDILLDSLEFFNFHIMMQIIYILLFSHQVCLDFLPKADLDVINQLKSH